MWEFFGRRRVAPSSILLLASALLTCALFVPWAHTIDRDIPANPATYYSPWNFLAAFFGGPPSIAEQPGDGLGVFISVLWCIVLLGPPLLFTLAAILRLCLSGLHRGWEIGISILAITLALLNLAGAALLGIIFTLVTFDNYGRELISDRGILFSVVGSICAVLAGIAFAVPSRRHGSLAAQTGVS